MTLKSFGIAKSHEKGFLSGPVDKAIGNRLILRSAFDYFRKTGFPFRRLPLHVCLQQVNQLASSPNDGLLNTTLGYQVADTYHPHRFEARYVDAKYTPLQAFEEDEFLLRALKKQIKYVGKIPAGLFDVLLMMGVARGCFNFRPGFALFVYRKFCKENDVVLDTCTGYGGRLVGFFSSQCGKYIGVDPNEKVYKGNLRMAKDFGKRDRVALHCSAVEDLDVNLLHSTVDFAFTSPPYFNTEVYSEHSSQSCVRYSEGEHWRKQFLVPMLQFQFSSLKPGKHSCVNIADVRRKGTVYPLVKWTIDSAQEVGFEYQGAKVFPLRFSLVLGRQILRILEVSDESLCW
jgi:hypothetical protein